MAVSQNLVEVVLRDQFGIPEFRPKQREVIDSLLSGNHTLALLPTGYGKSLCYQVPSQVLPGVTLVISPLIALMQDQVSGLKRRGVSNATVLNSHVSQEEQNFRLAGIKAGAFKLVYVAPERFESGRFRSLLSSIDLSLIVIDEAHCISQWGHDFRPHYRSLSQHLKALPETLILALTATATLAVQEDIVNILAPGRMRTIHASFDRPNLHLEVKSVSDSAEKDRIILKTLKQQSEPVIIYTSSRKETEALAGRLKLQKIKAAHYHAGMNQDQRARVQRNFETDAVPVIVSTVAFGMGVDKPNIRHVFHYNLPGSLEGYYQEAGRAGRDGKQATCTLLFQPKDANTQRFLMDKNFPTDQQIQSVYKYVVGHSPDGARVSQILAIMKIGDSALNSSLDLLKHLELIEQNVNGALSVRRVLGRGERIDTQYLQQRRLREAARLERMIQYGQKRVCRRLQILNYFGQGLENGCAGCDVCQPFNPMHNLFSLFSSEGSNTSNKVSRSVDSQVREATSVHAANIESDSDFDEFGTIVSPDFSDRFVGRGPKPKSNGEQDSHRSGSRAGRGTASPKTRGRERSPAGKSRSKKSTPEGGASKAKSAFSTNDEQQYTASSSRLPEPLPLEERTSEQAVQMNVLALVESVAGTVGRTTVAAVLTGSRAKKIIKSGLDASLQWGVLSYMNEDAVLRLVDQLIGAGQIKVRRGRYPKVRLTVKGQSHLNKLRKNETKKNETGQLTLKL
ncbi:MAG TPA: RecQ family ATP-dependent DNA helicase [Oculatellaceae cyanobacterium]